MAVEGLEFERAFRGAIQYTLNSGFSEILELRPVQQKAPYFTSSSVSSAVAWGGAGGARAPPIIWQTPKIYILNTRVEQ